MDHKDMLHMIASLSRIIGEKNLSMELEAIGWRDVDSHPVEFFRGYLSVLDDGVRYKKALNALKDDIEGIANAYGFDLVGDEFMDMIPR